MAKSKSEDKTQGALDPVHILPLPTPARSICFVSNGDSTTGGSPELNGNDTDSIGSDSDSDSDEEVTFRSSSIRIPSASSANPTGDTFLPLHLKNHLLATCHNDGPAILWDITQSTAKCTLSSRPLGLTIRRLHDNGPSTSTVMYQTRDPNGTVSFHDLNTNSVAQEIYTHSQTFCQAVPCPNNSHLVAFPSAQDGTAVVRDLRDPTPVSAVSVSDHGMLTSLALTCASQQGAGDRPVLACGMESGSVFLQDLTSSSRSSLSLTKDPILSLDMVPSETKDDPAVLVVAGMAGDVAEVAELPPSEQGRVALLKAISVDHSHSWNIRLRKRLNTCRIDEVSYGRPGVSSVRFRPVDGKLFAVGGWDHRVRLFDRVAGRPMAILRGHQGSINALDWAPDTTLSGLIATAGADDKQVYLWKCSFPNREKGELLDT